MGTCDRKPPLRPVPAYELGRIGTTGSHGMGTDIAVRIGRRSTNPLRRVARSDGRACGDTAMARTYSGIRTAVVAAALVFGLAAQSHALIERPVGQVIIRTWAFSLGFGWQWGYGTLYLPDGSEYDFRIRGLQFVGIGIANAELIGGVYGLSDLADFPGTYSAFEAGAAAFQGISGTYLENERGVIIRMNGEERGYRLQLGPKNLEIELYE